METEGKGGGDGGKAEMKIGEEGGREGGSKIRKKDTIK